MVIHKYEVIDGALITMPKGARVLHAGIQKSARLPYDNEGVFVWALVDPDAPMVQRLVVSYGTGHGMHPAATIQKYVGTVHYVSMPIVVHVFDLGETDEDGMPLETN